MRGRRLFEKVEGNCDYCCEDFKYYKGATVRNAVNGMVVRNICKSRYQKNGSLEKRKRSCMSAEERKKKDHQRYLKNKDKLITKYKTIHSLRRKRTELLKNLPPEDFIRIVENSD